MRPKKQMFFLVDIYHFGLYSVFRSKQKRKNGKQKMQIKKIEGGYVARCSIGPGITVQITKKDRIDAALACLRLVIDLTRENREARHVA